MSTESVFLFRTFLQCFNYFWLLNLYVFLALWPTFEWNVQAFSDCSWTQVYAFDNCYNDNDKVSNQASTYAM